MLLSEVLPDYDVRTRATLALVAPPEVVREAVRSTTLGELRLSRHLFTLRGLPSARSRSFLELEGFRTLAELPDELVVGAVGKPWSPRGGLVPGADPRTFAKPGYAVMALNVTYDGVTLATETRVRCTDASAHRRFRLYWIAVGPFSGIIRREWLRAIRRRVRSAV
jgi:hypothetical protein